MFKKLRHIIGWIAKTFGAVVALGLVFAYLSRYVSPSFLWFFAFFGLLFPVLFVLNMLLAAFWFSFKRKAGWIHIAVLIPGFFLLPAYVQLHTAKKEPETIENTLKIVSYNVHVFGIEYKTKTLKTFSNIAKFIGKESPDVVCLQEIAVFDTSLLQRTFQQYPHIYFYTRPHYNNSHYGIAVMSRYPIVNRGKLLFPGSANLCIYTDITIGNDTLRVYNNHLQSTKLNLAMSLSRFRQEDRRNEELREVSQRLRDAFVKRAAQVEIVTAHIAHSPYHVLVCGDFNDLPMSYTYRKMKGKLNDAFIAAGSGVPTTFHALIPAFRIDYIFNDDFLTAKHFYIPHVDYSDHYPVIAQLQLKN